MTSDARSHRSASRHLSSLVALCATLCLGACGASALAGGSAPPHPGIPAAALISLTALAKSSAAADGDPSVTSANAVLSTREHAVRVMSGDAVNTNDPVYLLQIKGHFTAFDASVPSGAALPKGLYLSLVVNVSNGQVDDWGVGNHVADLSSLDPVITLHF
jgi:hypothetical protein